MARVQFAEGIMGDAKVTGAMVETACRALYGERALWSHELEHMRFALEAVVAEFRLWTDDAVHEYAASCCDEVARSLVSDLDQALAVANARIAELEADVNRLAKWVNEQQKCISAKSDLTDRQRARIAELEAQFVLPRNTKL